MIKNSSHIGFFKGKRFFTVVSEGGFTIIELMIAMAIAAVVAISGFALFQNSNRSFQVQEDVGEAQQSARIAMDRIVRDIRTAGFGLPEPPYSLFGFDSPITVSDSSTGPDTITILGIGYEAGKLVGGTSENQKTDTYICYSSISNEDPFLTNGKVADTKKYVNIDGLFFVTLNTSTNSVACGGGGKSLPLASPSALQGDFDSGSVYIIQAVEYSIATDLVGCSPDNPCLASKDYSKLRGTTVSGTVGRQLLAENIEDIQFAYGLDANGDGKLDYTTYTTASFEDSTMTAAKEKNIKAVRVSLVAKTRNRDTKGLTFKRPAIENHPESAPDNYRRRTLTKIVKLRN